MCGIYGGFWQGVPKAPAGRLAEAQRLLHHRGPVDWGIERFTVAGGTLTLGHTLVGV